MTVFGSEPVVYRCPVCHGWFRAGNVSCAVAHAPGTCCHLGDTSVPGPA